MPLIIDPQNSGISGNMLLGALLGLGADEKSTCQVMEHYASDFGDIKIQIQNINKAGIQSTYAQLLCQDQNPITYTELTERLAALNHSRVAEETLNLAMKVFKTLAIAESKIHNVSLDEVHFHEVGAADAVADIMGCCYAFHDLNLNKDKVYGLPVSLGGGIVKTSHGKLAIPAPATLEILKNTPTRGGPVEKELTTPTGAALYLNLVDEYLPYQPLLHRKKIAYGGGKMDLDHPNVLRLIRGSSPLPNDQVSILETNVDNVSGEVLGHLFNSLMAKGALDVALVPVIMKKNRPGHLLRVITRPLDSDMVSEAIIRETGTLGVRVTPFVHRNIIMREIIPLQMQWEDQTFSLNVKVGIIGKEIINAAPEYEDAHKISLLTKLPLKEVMRLAEDAFWEKYSEGKIKIPSNDEYEA